MGINECSRRNANEKIAKQVTRDVTAYGGRRPFFIGEPRKVDYRNHIRTFGCIFLSIYLYIYAHIHI